MRALAGSGLDAETRMYVQITLYGYVQGIAANIEKERRAQAATGVTADEWMDEQGDELRWIGESRDYPAFVQLLDELGEFDLDLDRLFAFGLGALLDGLTPLIERDRGRNGR